MTKNSQSLPDHLGIRNTKVGITLTVLVLSALTSVSAANATCTRPAANPTLPDGETASPAEMKAGRDSVQNTVNLLQQYQSCLVKETASLPNGENSEEIKLAWAAQADAAIDNAQKLADRFSIELRKFKTHKH